MLPFSQSGFSDAVQELEREGKAHCIFMAQVVDRLSNEL